MAVQFAHGNVAATCLSRCFGTVRLLARPLRVLYRLSPRRAPVHARAGVRAPVPMGRPIGPWDQEWRYKGPSGFPGGRPGNSWMLRLMAGAAAHLLISSPGRRQRPSNHSIVRVALFMPPCTAGSLPALLP